MKAIRVSAFGGPEKLQLQDAERPSPGPGEALVKLNRAGINFIDIYMRNGSYAKSATYKTPLPMTLGMEGAGTVVELGAGVSGLEVGTRVAYCLARGSYAQYAAVPAWRLARIPDGTSDAVATALMLQGCTAHYLSHSAFPLGPEHSCLVHAGAGGVGQLLIQLAKRRGARVIATVGTADKAEIARARGADEVVLYRDRDFREAVMAFTSGRGLRCGGKGHDRAEHPEPATARSVRKLRRGLRSRDLDRAARAWRGGVDILHPPASRGLHRERGGNRVAHRRPVRRLRQRRAHGRHRSGIPAGGSGCRPLATRSARHARQAAAAGGGVSREQGPRAAGMRPGRIAAGGRLGTILRHRRFKEAAA
jgi:hypothetical protein